MSSENRFDKLIKFWPLFAALGLGVSGYFQLRWTVMDMKSDMDLKDTNIQHRRDMINEKELAEERRLTSLEKDVEWLKRGGQH